MNIDNVETCPFCGGKKIKYSIKTTTSGFNTAYHFQMYCNDCHCYGPRVFWKPEDSKHSVSRTRLEKDESFKKAALNSWNNRAPEGNEPVRHGHWITEKDPFGEIIRYTCSCCGEHWSPIDGVHWLKFCGRCPNGDCGAKMDEDIID